MFRGKTKEPSDSFECCTFRSRTSAAFARSIVFPDERGPEIASWTVLIGVSSNGRIAHSEI
jgi:hypothetical protein